VGNVVRGGRRVGEFAGEGPKTNPARAVERGKKALERGKD